MSKPLYVCYSLPLKKFLQEHGMRYEVGGRHMDTNKPFWVFIRTEELNKLLSEWSLSNN